MRTRLLLAALILIIVACHRQVAAAELAFDVASIRPSQTVNRDPPEVLNVETSPGTLTMRNVTVRSCIKWAYGVQDNQIFGPDLLNSDRYDIVAKAAGPVADNQLKLMLQALLAERFHLTLHHQSRETSVYALVVAKNGPKLHESEGEGKSNFQLGRGAIAAKWTTMREFADLLSGPMRTPVLDVTGLSGKYDFSVDVATYLPTEDQARQRGQPPDPASILMTALPEQVGLGLEARKASVEVLIVDHVEKPSETSATVMLRAGHADAMGRPVSDAVRYTRAVHIFGDTPLRKLAILGNNAPLVSISGLDFVRFTLQSAAITLGTGRVLSPRKFGVDAEH
jgi:uncharacterized protein (TIGR03435 family)